LTPQSQKVRSVHEWGKASGGGRFGQEVNLHVASPVLPHIHGLSSLLGKVGFDFDNGLHLASVFRNSSPDPGQRPFRVVGKGGPHVEAILDSLTVRYNDHLALTVL
jgi:hypothetical protein